MSQAARRDEGRFLAATFVTNLGNGIQTIAAAWLALVETGSALSVGALFVVVALPQVAASLSSGSLSDRGARKRTCIATDLARAVVVAAVPLALLVDRAVMPTLYVSTFLVSLLDAIFVPVANGWAQQFVAPDRRRRFSSHFELWTQAGMLLSVTAGGFLAQWAGAGVVFGVNAVSFLASAAFLAGMAPDPAGAPSPAGVPAGDGGAEGGDVDWRRVAPAVALFAQVRTIPTIMNTLTVVLVIDVFEHGVGILGLTDALAAIGFGSAAAVFGRVHRRVGDLGAVAIGFGGAALWIVPQPLFGQAGLMVSFTIATALFGLGRVGTRVVLMDEAGTRRAGKVFGVGNAVGLLAAAAGTAAVSGAVEAWSIEAGYFMVAGYLLVVTVVGTVTLAARRQPQSTPGGGSPGTTPGTDEVVVGADVTGGVSTGAPSSEVGAPTPS